MLLNTRVGQKTDYEKLVLEITTDGTIDPVEALTAGGINITDHIAMFDGFGKVTEEKKAPVKNRRI